MVKKSTNIPVRKIGNVPQAIRRKVQTDGWINLMTGVGTAKDKIQYSEVIWNQTSQQRAEQLFSADDIAGKIATLIPFDGIRRGITWKIAEAQENDDIIPWLDDEFTRLKVWEKFYWAWTLARVYGGALAVISVDDGRELSEPLDMTRIKQINAINVFDRWQFEIRAEYLIANPASPYYGEPEWYTYIGDNVVTDNPGAEQPRAALNSYGSFTPIQKFSRQPTVNAPASEGTPLSMFNIHRSRVIRFDGAHLTERLWKVNAYWHDSIYGRLWEPCRAYTMVHNSLASMLQELNQPVFKINGLAAALANDEEQLILAKLQQVNLSRSVARAVAIDSEDTFENVAAQTSGVDTLVQKAIDRLVAASNIPHTRMMGESPSGLGATGRSELTDYYDFVAAQQKIVLWQPTNYLTELIFSQRLAEFKEPEKWSFKFNPLEEPSLKEVKETQEIQARIDEIYMRTGVVDSFEIAQSRYGSGEYSYETNLDDEVRDDDGRVEMEEPEEKSSTEVEVPEGEEG